MRPPTSRFGTLFRTFVVFVAAIVIGGIAVGACLAALIPGTVEIATAHHYTAGSVKSLRTLSQQSTVYWSDGVTPMPRGSATSRFWTLTSRLIRSSRCMTSVFPVSAPSFSRTRLRACATCAQASSPAGL